MSEADLVDNTQSQEVLDAIIQKTPPGEEGKGQNNQAPVAKSNNGSDEGSSDAEREKELAAETIRQKEEKALHLRDLGLTDDEIEKELAEDDDQDVAKAKPEDDSEEGEDEELSAGEEEYDDDDDIDQYVVAVVVDGEEMEVSLKDLKSNFSGNQYMEQQIQKTVETRKQAEQVSSQLNQAYQQTYNQLMQLNQVLEQLATPDEQIDWDRLKAEDPATYLVKREEHREMRSRQQAVQQEAQRVKQEQDQIRADALQRYAQSEAAELVKKLPSINDPKQGPILKEKFVTTAGMYGYTPEEVGTVMDHRALLVLNDAAKWQEYQASKKKVMKSGKTSAKDVARVRPTKATSKRASNKRLEDKLRARARETGKPDDVAATLLVRK